MRRMNWLFAFLTAAALSVAPARTGEKIAPPRPTTKPREVRQVFSDGKHNAFTAMIRFKGQLFLAFRNGADHNSAQGDIIVLKSRDGKEWKEAFRMDATPDDRDPQFLDTGKRLILYDQAMTGAKLDCYAMHTEDGETWSKPQRVYEPDFILWKPFASGGKFYSASHNRDTTNGGKNRTVHFLTSGDGLEWKKLSVVRAGAWESETTVTIDDKGHATAFLRQKYGSPPCSILESDSPYSSWTERKPDVSHFSGHSVHTFKGVTYLLSRTRDGNTFGSMIYTYADKKLTPYCELPASGDCAYLEAALAGDDMLVSYYSQHETKPPAANIYVATVPLKK